MITFNFKKNANPSSNKYMFKLPSNDTTGSFKNQLLTNVMKAYPFLTFKSKVDYPYSSVGVELAKGGDYITVGMDSTNDISWLPSYANKYEAECIDLYTDFDRAMNALDNYARKNNPFYDDYDYITEFGTPVKIYNDFVQVGYNIIPRNNIHFLKGLRPAEKKQIINIIIKIKNYNLY